MPTFFVSLVQLFERLVEPVQPVVSEPLTSPPVDATLPRVLLLD